MIRIFKTDEIRSFLSVEELKCLEHDFRAYKEGILVPEGFGRDVRYDHPNTPSAVLFEEVKHIHLLDPDKGWVRGMRTLQMHRTSDTHLVYCNGAIYSDHYLLITILKSDAHSLANDRNVMFGIGRYAEDFRQKQ